MKKQLKMRLQAELQVGVLAPGAAEAVAVTVTAPAGTRTDDLAAPISAKYRITLDDAALSDPLEIAGDFCIAVDRVRPIPAAAGKVTVDGEAVTAN